jgi:hypothetical protein
MRRQPPDMEGTVKYAEHAVLNSGQGVVLQSGVTSLHVTKHCTRYQTQSMVGSCDHGNELPTGCATPPHASISIQGQEFLV